MIPALVEIEFRVYAQEKPTASRLAAEGKLGVVNTRASGCHGSKAATDHTWLLLPDTWLG